MPLETFIDDTDPSVEFSPSIDWPTVTPQNGYPEGVTARVADIPNINFSASLNFTGTGIRVIGIWMEGINQPTASYTIDGDILPYSPVPSPSSQATAGGMHMNITYFAKQDLPYGPHSLVIRPIMTGNPTGYEYVLDGFFVSRPNSEQDGGNNTVAESAVSRLANATSFSSDHSTTPALGTQTSSTSLPTTTATAGAVSGRNRRENLAGIVGGAVGGLFVLLLALFFTCRRKRWKVSVVINRHSTQTASDSAIQQITPLVLPPILPALEVAQPSPSAHTPSTESAPSIAAPVCPSEPPSYHSEGFVLSHPPRAPHPRGRRRPALALRTKDPISESIAEENTHEPPPAYTA